MAANRPMAVANSASAMPGATTASEVFFDAAIELERGHDAPDRAEQADERAGRGDGRQHQQIGFEPLDLARDRDVEHLFDARVQAEEGGAGVLERALPFAHRRDEQARGPESRPPDSER